MAVKQSDATTQNDATNQPSQADQGGHEPQSREQGKSGQQAQGRPRGQTQEDDQSQGGQDQRNRLARRNLSSTFMSPFTLLQRIFNDDVASVLTGVNRQRDGMTSPPTAASGRSVAWAPKVDVVQRGHELLIRADLPGVNADDVVVEIGDDSIAISGERREAHAEENDGIFRYETTYGAFFRELPLPEGALVDQAKASFKDGVLEIAVPAPPAAVSRGRRLEISRGEQSRTGEQSNPESPGRV
jgi:HSP20 family protein